MTANHYTTLGVARSADAEVIRAAYRALMRIYHPDRNEDPQAQQRARDITAAFAVLGDPEKRAAYDLRPHLDDVRGLDRALPNRAPPPPMRKVGMASVALALSVSLGFALGPELVPPPVQHPAKVAVPKPAINPVAPAVAENITPPPEIAAPAVEVAADLLIAAADDTAPAEPLPAPEPIAVAVADAPAAHPAVAPRIPRPAPVAVAVPRVRAAPMKPAPEVANDRRAQVERIASGFLQQSLEHADWHKQQLLLSARNRAAALRTTCRSDDCVANAYLRQIRDTTTIMEGRIPTP